MIPMSSSIFKRSVLHSDLVEISGPWGVNVRFQMCLYATGYSPFYIINISLSSAVVSPTSNLPPRIKCFLIDWMSFHDWWSVLILIRPYLDRALGGQKVQIYTKKRTQCSVSKNFSSTLIVETIGFKCKLKCKGQNL